LRLPPKSNLGKSVQNWDLFTRRRWRVEEYRAVLATKARIGRYG